ncbi:hypothetical protein DFQ30_003643 [Apophysomyces sp. BC1015]|nr:hypothetical protein DFQ30_003643 [Apophysomyces sp. BC1015]
MDADEGSSKASAARKKFDRSVGNVEPLRGKKRGHKCDLILRSQATDHYAPYEYGAGESGWYFGGIGCSKILIESGIKLPKVLKDMYDDIARNATLNMDKLA